MIVLVILVALIVLYVTAWNRGFTAGQRWERLMRTAAKPNPFGELTPMQPLGEEPTQYLDVDIVTRRLEPIGIATIAIRHNQPEARN